VWGVIVKQKISSLTEFHDFVSTTFHNEQHTLEVMKTRGYTSLELYEKLETLKIYKGPSSSAIADLIEAETQDILDWGILSRGARYLLEDRYVIPIRSIKGDVLAQVGWFPDYKKYITTPTKGFKKTLSFFNFDEGFKRAYSEFDGTVILVEGIFDAISISALGLPVIGTMGLDLTGFKREMLKRFKKVIAIPDSDKGGDKVSPYHNSGGKISKWKADTFIELERGLDIDDFINKDIAVAKEFLLEVIAKVGVQPYWKL
jgi:DNA primase